LLMPAAHSTLRCAQRQVSLHLEAEITLRKKLCASAFPSEDSH
jgi:hypothetical protein